LPAIWREAAAASDDAVHQADRVARIHDDCVADRGTSHAPTTSQRHKSLVGAWLVPRSGAQRQQNRMTRFTRQTAQPRFTTTASPIAGQATLPQLRNANKSLVGASCLRGQALLQGYAVRMRTQPAATLANPSRIFSSGKSSAMNTITLSRCSSGAHSTSKSKPYSFSTP